MRNDEGTLVALSSPVFALCPHLDSSYYLSFCNGYSLDIGALLYSLVAVFLYCQPCYPYLRSLRLTKH